MAVAKEKETPKIRFFSGLEKESLQKEINQFLNKFQIKGRELINIIFTVNDGGWSVCVIYKSKEDDND